MSTTNSPLAPDDTPKAITKPIPVKLRYRLWELKGMLLHVWLAYFLHADPKGFAWPSLATLHMETGYHEDKISAAKKELVRMGWLEANLIQKRKYHGMFGSKVYRIKLPADPRDH